MSNETTVFDNLVNSSEEYFQSLMGMGEDASFPYPPVGLQMAIRKVTLADIPKNFKSDYTFKQLKETETLTAIKDLTKLNEQSNKATKVSIALTAARTELTGKYRNQIDYILVLITEKPDRDEMIWKNTLNK